MREAAFMILCCALQYITSEIIDDKFRNILNEKNQYETKNETTSDEFEIDHTGNVVEKRTTHKEFLSKNGYCSDLDEGDVKIIEFVFTKDSQGRERIFEEDTTIKKVPGTTVNDNIAIPVTSSSSSSASAASQTPQSNSSVATGSAASASATASSNGGSSDTATVAGKRGEAFEKSAVAAAADSNGRTYGNSYGLTSIIGSNVGQEPNTIIQNIKPLSSSSSSTAATGSQDTEKIVIENINYPEPGPDASPTTKGASASAASAASGGPGSGTTAESAAGTQGPASGSTSAASSSGPRSGVRDPESISDTQGSSEGPEEGGPYENASGRGGVYGPGPRSSSSSGDSSTKKGDKKGTQRPESKVVTKQAGAAPGKRPTGSDFYEPGYYGEYEYPPQLSIVNYNKGSSATSSAAASAATEGSGSASSAESAAGTQGPASGSTSAASSSSTSSDAGSPGSISCTQGSSGGSEEGEVFENASERGGNYGPGSGSSGSRGDSVTKKGDKSGTQRPERGAVTKLAGTAPGKRPTGSDFYEPGYYGEYDVPPQLSIINYNTGSSAASSAAASAANEGSGSASSAESAAGTQGPASGSTLAASSSSTSLDAGGPGSISGTQRSSGGSEEGEAFENASGRGGNYGPGSGSSGSRRDSVTKKGEKSGTQRPERGAVTKLAGTAPGKRPTGSDFYEPGYYGENDVPPQLSIINYNTGSSTASSAAASAATEGSGSASSAESAAGTQGPASGSTSAASSSSTSSDAGRGGNYGPGSGSSGSPGDSSTKKGDKTGTQRPESGAVTKLAGTAPGKRPTGLDFYRPGYYGKYDVPPQLSIINYNTGSSAASSAAASAATEGSGSASSAESAAGTQGPGSGSTSAASSSSTSSDAGRGGNYGPGSGSSGSPGDSSTKKGDKTGTQRPESGAVTKLAGTAPGKRPTGLDFYRPGYYGKYDVPPQLSIINYNTGSSAASSAAASAATEGSGSASSAESAAGTQGPGSGSTSAASSSSTRSDAGGPGIISGTQGSSAGSEEGEANGKRSGPGGVCQRPKPIHKHGSSGSPVDLSTKKGDKTGTQRPESGPVSKLAGTAPEMKPTGLDLYGPGYYGKYYSGPQVYYNKGSSAASSAAASAATEGSGSASSAESAAGTQVQKRSGRGGVYQPYGNQRPKPIYKQKTKEHGSSGFPVDSSTKKGDKTGTQRPESGAVTKLAGTAPGKRPTGLDFNRPGYYGKYDVPPQLSIINYNTGSSAASSAAASAAIEGSGSASSAQSAGGTQGPASGSTSAASSSSTSSDAGSPGSISCTQGSSGGSEEGEVFENASERGGNYGPGSGSSGSRRDSVTKKGDKSGTQRPKYRPVSKPVGDAPEKRPTGLDFYGPDYYEEYDVPPQQSIINYNIGSSAASSAAASAATEGSGSASSVESAAGTQGPGSGSTSAASSSSTRSDAGGPGSISCTQGSSGGSEKGEAFENASGRGGNYGPGSGSSGSRRDSVTKKGEKSGTQRPERGAVTKLAGTAPGKRPTGSDFYEPGYYGENDVPPQLSIINYNKGSSAKSSAAASAATEGSGSASSAESVAGTQGPASGSTSAASSSSTSSDADGPGSISSTKGSSGGSEEGEAFENASARGGNYGPGSGSSDSPPDSTTKKGDKSGQRPKYRPVSKPVGDAPEKRPTGLDFYGPDYYEEYDVPPQQSIINYNTGSSTASSAAASAATEGSGSASSAESAAGTQGPASGSTSAASSSSTSSDAERGGNYGPGSGSSGSPDDSSTKKGDKSGTQRPEYRPVSKPVGYAPEKRPTGLDFYLPDYYEEYDVPPQLSIINYNTGSSTASSAAASAATEGSGSASSAQSAGGTQGPASGSTSAASSSSTSSDAGGPGSISCTQGSSGGSEEGEAFENVSGRGGNYGPGSGSSGSPGDSTTKKGDKSETQRPKYRPVSKPVGDAPEKRPTGLDFYGPDYYEEYDVPPQQSIINYNTGSSAASSAAASAATEGSGSASSAESAAGTQAQASESASAASSSSTRSDAGGPGSISCTQGSSGGSEKGEAFENASGRGGNYGPGSGSSGSRRDSVTKKGEKSGTQRPERGTVTKLAGTAPGKRPTGSDFYEPGYYGENDVPPQLSIINYNKGSSATSSAAASAATEGSGSASSAESVAGTQGPASGSTSAASSSSTSSDAGGPGSISSTKGSSGGSEEGEAFENASGRGGNYGPGSGSSDSPPDSTTKKGDKSGTQRPKYRPVSKPVGDAPEKRSTGLDFYGPDYYEEYDVPPQQSIINYNTGSSTASSAAASAATEGSGSASSAESAAGTQGPASGSTSAASSSSTSSDAERGGNYGPGSGSSGSPGDSSTKKGDKSGTQRPEYRPVSKPVGYAPEKRPTGLDFYLPDYYEEYDVPPQLSIINYNTGSSTASSAAASAATEGSGSASSAESAAGTQGPASGSTSAASSSSTSSDAGRGGNYGPGSGSSGSPGDSSTKKGDKSGTQRPEYRPVSKPVGYAPEKRPTGLDFYLPDYFEEYDVPPQLSIINYNTGSSTASSAAASAATEGSGSASSAESAAGTQGPGSGSTSAASSSSTFSDAGGPGIISGTQRSSAGSEEGEANGKRSGPGGVYQRPKPIHKHGSSGSPVDLSTKKGDKTGTQRPESGPVSKLAGTAPEIKPTGLDFYGPGYYGKYYSGPQVYYNKGSSAASSAAASAATEGSGSASSAESAAGTQVRERSGRGGVYQPYGNQRPKPIYKHKTKEHGSSGFPVDSSTKKGDKTGTQRPESGAVTKLAGTAPGKRPTGLDFYRPGYYGKYDVPPQLSIINYNTGSSAASSAAASAATEGSGSASSAESAAGTQGPGSGSTSAASSSSTRSDAGGPGIISGTQGSSAGSEEGEANGKPSGPGGVYQRPKPIHKHGSSGSPVDLSTKKGDKTGTQRPESGPVSKLAGTAPEMKPTGLDLYGPGYYGKYYSGPQVYYNKGSSAASSAAASAATEGSGSASSAESAAGTQVRERSGRGGVYQPYGNQRPKPIYKQKTKEHGSSGFPVDSSTKKGDKTGTQRPESGAVTKLAGTAPGKRPTGLDFNRPGYYGKYDVPPQLSIINYNTGSSAASSAAASAATEGSGSASSAESAAGTQGPGSGSTSAASSSSTRSDAGGPGIISGTQGSSAGSEEGEANGKRSGQGGVYQRPKPIHKHGSSGSPVDLSTKKGDKTGTQRPESGPVSKLAGTAPEIKPTGLDFYGPGYYGKYYSGPQVYYNKGSSAASSAAASAATEGSGSASSAESAAGTQVRERSGRGGVYQPYGNQRPKPIYKHKTKEHGSSGFPVDSSTKKGDKTGTQRPESGAVTKLAGTAPGKRPTGLDFYRPGYYGKYDVPPQLSIINYNTGSSAASSAAASAATEGSGSASSAESAAGTQGPGSGSTSAASSSSTRSDAGGPGIISGTQGSSAGSEEGEANGKPSGPGGVYQRPKPIHKHGSSGSPVDLSTKKGDKTGTQRPESGPVSKLAGTAPEMKPTGLDFYGPGYYGKYYSRPQVYYNKGSSAASSAAASAATEGSGSASSAESAAGTQVRERSGRGGVYQPYGNQRPKPIYKHKTKEHGSSGFPVDSSTKKGDKTGTQRPESGAVTKLAGTAPGKRPTGLDFNRPGYYGKYDVPPQLSIINYNSGSSAASSAATSAATEGSGSASSAESAAGTQGPGSGSTSAASSSSTRSDAGGPGIISGTQGSSAGSEEGEANGKRSGPGGVYQRPKPIHKHGSSGSPVDLSTKKGDKTGTQRPESGPVSKLAGTAPEMKPTGLDFYGPGYYGKYYSRPQVYYNKGSSAASSAAASAATEGSGSASSAESAVGTQVRERSGRGGVYQPYGNQRPKPIYKHKTKEHGSSGFPVDSSTKKGDKTGTQRPESGAVTKLAGTAPGKRPTGLDFNRPGYYGKYDVPPQLSIINYNSGSSAASSAAASAATEGSGSASSAESAAGTQGPGSGSTSAASSSSTRSDAGGPGIISGTQGSSAGSEEGEANGKRSGPGGVCQRPKPIHKHGSLGSPVVSSTKKGDKTGTQRPESGAVTKLAGTAPEKRPTGSDFYGPGYYGKYYSGPQVNYNKGSSAASSAAASAATEGSGSASSVDSITGNHQNELGPSSYLPGYYGPNYLAPQDLLIIEDNAVGTANNINSLKSGSSGTLSASPNTKEGVTGTQQPGSGPTSKRIDSITGNNQNWLGPDSYGLRYGQDYLATQELLSNEDNAVGSATNTNRPESGSSGTPGASPTTKEGVSGTQRPGSRPASKPVDNITGSSQNELEPHFYEPRYYGQDYSAPDELPTVKYNDRGSESSSSPVARAPAGESTTGIPDAPPTRNGVASGVTSVQGKKRVRQACRLRSSQFVLRLGRKGQPCTFCY